MASGIFATTDTSRHEAVLRIASAEEVGVETLAERLSAEVTASNGTLVWIYLVGAVARTPGE